MLLMRAIDILKGQVVYCISGYCLLHFRTSVLYSIENSSWSRDFIVVLNSLEY